MNNLIRNGVLWNNPLSFEGRTKASVGEYELNEESDIFEDRIEYHQGRGQLAAEVWSLAWLSSHCHRYQGQACRRASREDLVR